MTDLPATLHTVAGKPVLRFERRLAHSPDRVWQAVTDPAEMRQWFPATVETTLHTGARMQFRFEGDDTSTEGEIIEFDPPKVYAFRWNDDVLRFELLPNDTGCLLVFTHTLGGGWIGELTAGRSAAGWDTCLAALDAQLDGAQPTTPGDMLPLIEGYVDKFGHAAGTVELSDVAALVRFRRDLLWVPVTQMWQLLTEEANVEPGAPPPLRFTTGYVDTGLVTVVDAPSVLEYSWLHEGREAGRVRWELFHDPKQGTRVELTHVVPRALDAILPTVLAAWQTHLEILFATAMGADRCWPEGRVEELRQRYAEQLP
jgi:uncharacterized protein YndB with AHSA1/START domain